MAKDSDPRRPQGRIGSFIKNKWRIDERLGAGAMATVYAATHRNGNRVALKMLNSDLSHEPTVRARFLREGYVANAVGHPGAVKILDDDVAEDGCVFLVMELLEGESLETRREHLGGRLPIEEVFTVGDQLLDLLAVAHERGIVHRDIKPPNVFVTHEGVVKVLDFGIARMRWSSGERTGTGLMLGTPDFMSPEQAGGQPDEVDARSDLWSVGATMFTLLSGQSVHTAETLHDYLMMIATQPARSLATAAPHAPRQLVQVVDRALELHRERRWPDARAMQDALRWAYKVLADKTAGRMSATEMVTIPISPRDAGSDERTQYEPVPPHLMADLNRTLASAESTGVSSLVPSSDPPSVTRSLPAAMSVPFDQMVTRPIALSSGAALDFAPRAGAPVFSEPQAAPGGSGIIASSPSGATSQPPSNPTLGAHSKDTRTSTASTKRRSGRFGVVALVVLVAALAGLAFYVAAVGFRDPRRGARSPMDPTNAAPQLGAAQLTLPALARTDAGADARTN